MPVCPMAGPAHRRDARAMLSSLWLKSGFDWHIVWFPSAVREQAPSVDTSVDAAGTSACATTLLLTRGSLLRPRHRLYLHTFPDEVAWVHDELLTLFEAREHFQAIAEIPAQLDSREMHRAARSHHSYLGSIAAHHQGIPWNHQRRIFARHREIHFRILTGH